MNDEKLKETELGNSILAITGGAAAAILTGLILSPVMQWIADEFWEWDFSGHKNGISVNDFILYGSFLLWVFLAALAGGFTCSLICRSYEYTHALILISICMALLLFIIIVSDGRPNLLFQSITLIIFGTGFLSGTKIGVRKKKRRKDKPGLDF